MFVGKWLERGCGRIVAPDPNYEEKPEELEQTIFSSVAPLPSTARTPLRGVNVPPSTAFSHNRVTCENCQQEAATTVRKTVRKKALHAPVNPYDERLPEVEDRVLEAARDTAQKKTLGDSGYKVEREFLEFCVKREYTPAQLKNSKLSTKQLDKIERNKQTWINKLAANPQLAETRAIDLQASPPDSFTPLMAVAMVGNISLAKVLLDYNRAELLQHRDYMGRTALHIAAAKGEEDFVEFLLPYYAEENLPVDLNLHTPLAAASTSKAKGAPKTRQRLFSPIDSSVLGSPYPEQLRVTTAPHMVAAYADIPGLRILFEDAICTQVVDDTSILAAVCDGHADGGMIARYVADAFAARVTSINATQKEWWREASLAIDADLKKTGKPGGTTAAIALITPDELVVAHVGDSRCILVQTEETDPKEGEEKEDDENPIPGIANISLQDAKFRVISLTQDHTPSLETEKKRIEAAGLSVVEEAYTKQDGTEHVLHKVALSEQSRLAMSRAFGDFDYKANKSLPADQQAITAVPDVAIRQRCERDLYAIVACDGIWDVMTAQEVGEFVAKRAPKSTRKTQKSDLVKVADELLDECLKLGSQDNMSVVIVALGSAASPFVTEMEKKALNYPSPTAQE